MRIADILPKGEENAIKTAELVRLLGVASSRELRQLVSKEREAGALILSTLKGGYFLPDDGEKGKAELAAYVRTLKAHALNTLKVLKPANKALKAMEAPETERHTA